MLNRRACALALGHGVFLHRGFAATRRRFALLLAVPWEGEMYLGNDLSAMDRGLRARGLQAEEMMSVLRPIDRQELTTVLSDVRRRIAKWDDSDVLVYYSGHGMYRSTDTAVPEAGLQLNRDRGQPSSWILWRDLVQALGAPPNVRVLVVPDCCHTNLLAGRLSQNVTALIMKSTPQSALTCRTGTAVFREGSLDKRYGVISYYASRTLAGVDTAGEWLSAMGAAADRDVKAGTLGSRRRVNLMVEGNANIRVLGLRVQPRGTESVGPRDGAL